MDEDFFGKQSGRERETQRGFAAEHGYTVKQGEGGGFYVYARGSDGPIALAASDWDAIQIAYAMSVVFPRRAS